MVLHYKGKYSGNESDLPVREHVENFVPFKEPQDLKSLAVIANAVALGLLVLFAVPPVILGREYFLRGDIGILLGAILPVLTLFPHEFLHALCFRGDVEMYTNLKQGMCFVIGTEDMSKARFVFMSLFPNLIFGILPYVVWLFCPSLLGFGIFGALCTSMGGGDYMNVWNALTQVPKGARICLSGLHSYWHN